MTLRTRLLIAQAPLALALAAVAVLSVVTSNALGRAGERILSDNYRSVLAAQRMKESIERLDSGALFVVIGERERGLVLGREHRPAFEAELQVEERNITEPGEAEAARRLREAWTEYQSDYDRFLAAPEDQLRQMYLDALQPGFVRVKAAADEILAINQDAMVLKSTRLRRQAELVETAVVVGVLAALVLGLLAAAALTARALRPVAVLGQSVRRLGQGDYAVRARVPEGGGSEITQLARDFNAMAESLQRYRDSSLGELLEAQLAAQATIDSLPDPVVVFDIKGKVANANRAAEQILGIRGSDGHLGSAPPEVRERVERIRDEVLSGAATVQPRGFEDALLVESSDGNRALLPRANRVSSDEGQLLGATVLLQDITRLRRFDELKDDLVATVAHEFRTPLTSLRMAIHLLAEQTVGSLSEQQLDLVSAAREECDRLQGIVDDLLDLARIRSGRLELHPRELSTEVVLGQALREVRDGADQRSVPIELDIRPGAERLVADPDRIDLALNNLLANAVQHGPAGRPVVVRALRVDGGVRIEVRDDGPGI
ncbi:MAG TPA: histidine kinase dimerization/phospho-acceptor domain-containing protein, partial [Myxococcaceae bacterium]|nr:histidine kinase dimerization/phospho-acceptor domain-containing protein [Myxococcaceae bacterium]